MKKAILTILTLTPLYTYADVVSDYVTATSTINNFYETTGFNIIGVNQWVGSYIIKNFLGMVFLILTNIKSWIIVLMILSGVLYLALRAFRFYKH